MMSDSMTSPDRPPSGEPADSGTDLDELELQLMDRYWEERRGGAAHRPHDWLEAHGCSSPGVRDQIEVMDLAQESNERRTASGERPAAGVSARSRSQQSGGLNPSLKPGTQLAGGELWVLGWLGAGGMGEIYRAWNNTLGREVVVKLAQGPASRARFRREIEIHDKLGGQKNIALVRTAGQHEGGDYLVMDYVAGLNLQQWVKANGPMAWDEACGVVREAAAGLEHAHEHQIVHRDIKPSNLVRQARGGGIKIIDWGLARRMDTDPAKGDLDLTDSGCCLGTWGYMSPEQIRSPSTVGPQSDLYSLGCTLFYLLTGESLFGTSLERPRRPPRLPASVDAPPQVETLFQSLLAYEPAERCQSARKVVEAIDAIMGVAQEGKPALAARESARRHSRLGWAAALALGALVLTAGWWRHSGRLSSREQPKQASVPQPEPSEPEPLARYSAPSLEDLTFKFERFPRIGQKSEYEIHHLVKNHRSLAVRPTRPLVMKEKDSESQEKFVVDGAFRKPTHWYVVWIDTKGAVDVPEGSPDRRSRLLYPNDDGYGACPDTGDPLGTHLALIVAGELPLDDARPRLKGLLAGIGKPPDLQPGERWSYRLRSDEQGEEAPALTRSPQSKPLQTPDWEQKRRDYLDKIQQRLADTPVEAVHAFFVSTKR